MTSTNCPTELNVLFYSPARRGLRAFVSDIEAARHEILWMPGAARVTIDELNVVLCHERSAAAMVQRLEHEYAHLVLLDLRPCDEGTPFSARARDALELLDLLDHREDIEARYGFHRIVALVSDDDGRDVDTLLLELGARGIRHALRDEATDHQRPFAVRVLTEACRIIRSRSTRKTALCLSGGGITGVYFELGVLKCLSDCLPPAALNNVDMLFGISAGAVVSSALAVGYSVDEFMASLVGHEDTRMPRLDLRLVRFGHLDYQSAIQRAKRALASAARWVVRLPKRRRRGALDDLLLDYSDVVGPLFRSDGFERMLRAVLDVPGATNDFRELRHELYIGTSDQDARRHVLFGARPFDHIPISKATQASLSFPPAFPSVEIEWRYYEDGAVTRTSNFIEAIRRDASLVVVVDPFLPYVSKEAGAARARGLVYQMDQSIRTMSYTRFENARDWALRRYPEVSVYTFLPSNRQRRLLSMNPMDHRPYLEVWRSAYLSTMNRLERLKHRLGGDLRAHGLAFDPTAARCVAKQLEGQERPDFADFYPDRQVEVPKPTFVLHRPETAGVVDLASAQARARSA